MSSEGERGGGEGRGGGTIAIKTERVDPDKEFSLVFTVG